jgi:pentapeptide MXKDX repeat protein
VERSFRHIIPSEQDISTGDEMRKLLLAATLIGFSVGGAFAQTPSPAGQNSTSDKMSKDTMSKDGMKKDSTETTGMKKDGMSKDSMSKDSMKDTTSKDGMKKDGMK